MAGSPTRSVYDIFQSMESGPAAAPGLSSAQAWLDHHSRSLALFINGHFVQSQDRQTRPITDSKGASMCTVTCASAADVSSCCSGAVDGHRTWSQMTSQNRAKVLLRLVSVVGQHSQCVSQLCELSAASCSGADLIRLLQFYSGWARLRDALLAGWTPRGVVAVVVSDVCSLFSLLMKVLPALSMGNSVVLVPGASTAPPALLLAQLFTGVGLPAGALNVLTGSDPSVGAQVAQESGVDLVTFCGNKQDGAHLCRAAAGGAAPVRVSACVGAACPFIVFESADIDSAVDGAIEAAFSRNKEVSWVLLVQESVLAAVVSRLRLRLSSLRSVCLRSQEEQVQVQAAVQEAQQQGATLIQPSAASAPPPGAVFPPTVLCGSAPSSPWVVAPPPGPLLPLMTFRSNTEAVALGNHSPHGLAASVWTEDLTLALETARSLSVGCVWVNSHSVRDPCLPVSGHKDSGSCTDGGQEGLYQFLLPPCSSSSSRLPRSSSPLDYSQFGAAAAAATIVPDESDAASAPKSYLQFVAGKACQSVSGCSVAVRPPGGGSVTAYCPDGGRKDVRNAVEAASKVQPGWMKKSASARAHSLYLLAKVLEAKRRDVAAPSEEEAELSIARLSDWAAYCDKVQGRALSMPQSGSALSIPEALGVVGVVLPDESPLLSLVTLLGAAIAAGNAVVMVPSEKHPLVALSFIQVLQASDLPAGLVNVVSGGRDQLTAALANHSVIKAVWYWGSAQGAHFLRFTCTGPLKTLRLCCQGEGGGEGGSEGEGRTDWTHPAVMEAAWRDAVQWKSVWIPTA